MSSLDVEALIEEPFKAPTTSASKHSDRNGATRSPSAGKEGSERGDRDRRSRDYDRDDARSTTSDGRRRRRSRSRDSDRLASRLLQMIQADGDIGVAEEIVMMGTMKVLATPEGIEITAVETMTGMTETATAAATDVGVLGPPASLVTVADLGSSFCLLYRNLKVLTCPGPALRQSPRMSVINARSLSNNWQLDFALRSS